MEWKAMEGSKFLLSQKENIVQPVPANNFLSPDFFASLGVTGVITFLLFQALSKALPIYLTRQLARRDEEFKAELAKDASVHGTMTDFTRTLLANQLQTSRQFQEELSDLQSVQSQQIGIILRLQEENAVNQNRIFEIGTGIREGLSDLRLELEKNRYDRIAEKSQ